jgi:hypothetical protein
MLILLDGRLSTVSMKRSMNAGTVSLGATTPRFAEEL